MNQNDWAVWAHMILCVLLVILISIECDGELFYYIWLAIKWGFFVVVWLVALAFNALSN